MGDPSDPLSLNRYVYCGMDPVNFVDPTGFNGVAVLQWTIYGLEGAGLTIGAITGVDEVVIGLVFTGSLIYQGVKAYDNFLEAKKDKTNSGKQDKKLSDGEIQKLKDAGYDVHELKGGKNASKKDLYKTPDGKIVVKPKGGAGEGDPTGLNMNDF